MSAEVGLNPELLCTSSQSCVLQWPPAFQQALMSMLLSSGPEVAVYVAV